LRIPWLNLCGFQYLTDLKDWSVPIAKLDKMISKDQRQRQVGAAASSTFGNQLMLAPQPSIEAHMFSKQLLLLLNGLSHTETSSLHKIYANFSFAAAAVGFSSNASWWNIEDVTGLKVQMRRYVFPPHLFQDCRFHVTLRLRVQAINPTFFQQFNNEFFAEVKLSYQIAAALSPLVFLLPKKTSGRKIR
jgi:hypothetical protein